MGGMRKQFTREFKANVALAAIKGDKTIAELCSEYGAHASQINAWEKTIKEGVTGLFSGHSNKGGQNQEVEIESLYKNIGKLQVENDWLKKNYIFNAG